MEKTLHERLLINPVPPKVTRVLGCFDIWRDRAPPVLFNFKLLDALFRTNHPPVAQAVKANPPAAVPHQRTGEFFHGSG